jgi:CheY-like chemotaxis protein
MAVVPQRRVLVVDDEALIAMLIADMLDDLGCSVVGPALSLDDGLELARDADIDWAILDLALNGKPSLPIAEILRERNIPFVFASGYANPDQGGDFEHIRVIQKPFDISHIASALDQVERIGSSKPDRPEHMSIPGIVGEGL